MEFKQKKFTSIHASQMGFCSINPYSSAGKSESFGALQILFLRMIFVQTVVEI